MINKRNSDLLRLTVITCLLFFFIWNVETVSKENIQSNGLFPSVRNAGLFEINRIEIDHKDVFTESELIEIISLRTTHRNFIHKLLQYYLTQINSNSTAKDVLPDALLKHIDKIIESMSSEINYFDKVQAAQDIISLRRYYFQNGFHDAEVWYSFLPDSSSGENVLRFYTESGKRALIDTVLYIGLDDLPPDTERKVLRKKNIKSGRPYIENTLMTEIQEIQRVLLDDGFYYSRYETPVVSRDTLNNTDSVTVRFSVGERQRIGKVSFIDSTKGQQIVSYNMKLRQLEFSEGDWYSRSNIERSDNNLHSLGTFDLVSIDTSSIFAPVSDSVIPMNIYTEYRKQQEWGAGLFMNRTAVNNYLNVGVELAYFHRNLGGAAQSFKPFIRGVMQYQSGSINNFSDAEFEFQSGISFAQPLLFIVDKARVGLSFQASYSIRTISRTLKMNTFAFPLKFPIKLHKWTYFNNIDVTFTLDRQSPLNFSAARNKELENAETALDSLNVVTSLDLYANLADFVKNSKPYLTGNVLSITLLGDGRNSPFSPSKGYFTALTVEGYNPIFYGLTSAIDLSGSNITDKIMGISKYTRLQMTNLWYWSLNKQLVLALKQREGWIYWFDKENSYVPLERQFFTGGANSIRGWPSRLLRYYKGHSIYDTKEFTDDFASNFIGSTVMIEGSLEFRYSLKRRNESGPWYITFLQDFGITGFIDWGNSFNWAALDDNSDYRNEADWHEYITGIAVAGGFGIRYDTPVGPARLDFAWPIYMPSSEKHKLIFDMPDAFARGFNFHIGLGHSF